MITLKTLANATAQEVAEHIVRHGLAYNPPGATE